MISAPYELDCTHTHTHVVLQSYLWPVIRNRMLSVVDERRRVSVIHSRRLSVIRYRRMSVVHRRLSVVCIRRLADIRLNILSGFNLRPAAANMFQLGEILSHFFQTYNQVHAVSSEKMHATCFTKVSTPHPVSPSSLVFRMPP